MENPKTRRHKLPKQTRLCSKTAIDALFASGRGALAYPLRAICAESDSPGVRFFVSIPKKRLRHAVDRVTMRRRVREAYRLLRPGLPEGLSLNIAFVYVADRLIDFDRVSSAVGRLLEQITPRNEEAAD
ncbi:MAG: ribonuclease P protein component [Muribaculaceae bacterium]|nr:ribonuclease P protein component [Muribaculaceae bacterium]